MEEAKVADTATNESELYLIATGTVTQQQFERDDDVPSWMSGTMQSCYYDRVDTVTWSRATLDLMRAHGSLNREEPLAEEYDGEDRKFCFAWKLPKCPDEPFDRCFGDPNIVRFAAETLGFGRDVYRQEDADAEDELLPVASGSTVPS